jgi:transcriptional regulator NrdR family protein
MTTLRDYELCPKCHGKGRVVDSRKRKGYRRRMHRCRTCKIAWPSFQSVINPRRVSPAA